MVPQIGVLIDNMTQFLLDMVLLLISVAVHNWLFSVYGHKPWKYYIVCSIVLGNFSLVK